MTTATVEHRTHGTTSVPSSTRAEYAESWRLHSDVDTRRRARQRLYGDHTPVRTAYWDLVYTYIMLLDDHPGMVKIGHSSDPVRRSRSLTRSAYGPARIMDTWPTDVERAVLRAVTGSLGTRRAHTRLPGCTEAVDLDPQLMDAATGLVYSLLLDPTRVGLDWLTPQTVGDHKSWVTTTVTVPTLRGGDVDVIIVDGTCVPLIPTHVLERLGVTIDLRDIAATQRCRTVPWTAPGTPKAPTDHQLTPAVPVWRALDGVIQADLAGTLDGERDEVCARLVWAAGRAAYRAEREYHGTKTYINHK